MTHWYDSRLAVFFFAAILYTCAALVAGGAILGCLWVLIYQPAWLGVAAFVMVIVAFALWVSWMRG